MRKRKRKREKEKIEEEKKKIEEGRVTWRRLRKREESSDY